MNPIPEHSNALYDDALYTATLEILEIKNTASNGTHNSLGTIFLSPSRNICSQLQQQSFLSFFLASLLATSHCAYVYLCRCHVIYPHAHHYDHRFNFLLLNNNMCSYILTHIPNIRVHTNIIHLSL